MGSGEGVHAAEKRTQSVLIQRWVCMTTVMEVLLYATAMPCVGCEQVIRDAVWLTAYGRLPLLPRVGFIRSPNGLQVY